MTIEKVFQVIMVGMYQLFDALGNCVFSINSTVDISLLEFIFGVIIVQFIIGIVAAFSWGS